MSSAVTLVLLALTGCATPPEAHGAQAVMCSKCETVWVERYDHDDPYGMTYRSEQATVCPDCHAAVVTFFRTGEWKHSCDTCGDALVHCTEHD